MFRFIQFWVVLTIVFLSNAKSLNSINLEECHNTQCREALSKATRGSSTSVWMSDAIGTLRLYSPIFQLDRNEMDKWEISKFGPCKKSIKTKYFSSFDKYIKFIDGKSSFREKVDVDDVFYDPPDRRNFTMAPPYKLSGKYLEKMQFFLDGGAITTSVGECIVYDIKLKDVNNLPKFSTSFIDSLKMLYNVSNKNKRSRENQFKIFRQSFGDYFFARSQIGMQFSYSRSIRSKATSVSRKVIKSCNHKTLAISINIKPARRYRNVKCTTEAKKILGESTYRVNGGTFQNMKTMINSDIRGNPIKYKLLPITQLINDYNLKRNNITSEDGRLVSSGVILQWLLPLYHEKLKDYTVKNECPEGYKLFGNWERHSCEPWSEWSCNVNCGRGKWKSRKRSCHGCLGKTWDIKKEKCFAKKMCSQILKDASIFDRYFSRTRQT